MGEIDHRTNVPGEEREYCNYKVYIKPSFPHTPCLVFYQLSCDVSSTKE